MVAGVPELNSCSFALGPVTPASFPAARALCALRAVARGAVACFFLARLPAFVWSACAACALGSFFAWYDVTAWYKDKLGRCRARPSAVTARRPCGGGNHWKGSYAVGCGSGGGGGGGGGFRGGVGYTCNCRAVEGLEAGRGLGGLGAMSRGVRRKTPRAETGEGVRHRRAFLRDRRRDERGGAPADAEAGRGIGPCVHRTIASAGAIARGTGRQHGQRGMGWRVGVTAAANAPAVQHADEGTEGPED